MDRRTFFGRSAADVTSDERAPVIPQPVDVPLPPVPTSETVTTAEADDAVALWDREMPAYAGILESEVVDAQG